MTRLVWLLLLAAAGIAVAVVAPRGRPAEDRREPRSRPRGHDHTAAAGVAGQTSVADRSSLRDQTVLPGADAEDEVASPRLGIVVADESGHIVREL